MALLALLKYFIPVPIIVASRESALIKPQLAKTCSKSAAAIRTTLNIYAVKNNVVSFQCLLAGMLSVFLLKILGADNHPDQHKKTSEEAYKKLSTIAYEMAMNPTIFVVVKETTLI